MLVCSPGPQSSCNEAISDIAVGFKVKAPGGRFKFVEFVGFSGQEEAGFAARRWFFRRLAVRWAMTGHAFAARSYSGFRNRLVEYRFRLIGGSFQAIGSRPKYAAIKPS